MYSPFINKLFDYFLLLCFEKKKAGAFHYSHKKEVISKVYSTYFCAFVQMALCNKINLRFKATKLKKKLLHLMERLQEL